MKPEARKTFYISVAMIFLLSVVSLWRMRNIDYSDVSLSFPSQEIAPTLSLGDITAEKMEEIIKERGFFPDESKKEKNYTRKTVEEKFSFDYPSSWKKTEVETKEDTPEKIEVLFFASSDKIFSPTVLTVFKIENENPEEVFATIESLLELEGSKNIKKEIEKINEKEYFLKIKYQEKGGMDIALSSKLIFEKNICYMLVVSFFKDHPPLSETIEYILSSAQIKNSSSYGI